jgi:hypothetical protein
MELHSVRDTVDTVHALMRRSVPLPTRFCRAGSRLRLCSCRRIVRVLVKNRAWIDLRGCVWVHMLFSTALTLAYAPGSDLGFWTDIPNESGYYSAFDYLDVFQGFGRERDLRHP